MGHKDGLYVFPEETGDVIFHNVGTFYESADVVNFMTAGA